MQIAYKLSRQLQTAVNCRPAVQVMYVSGYVVYDDDREDR